VTQSVSQQQFLLRGIQKPGGYLYESSAQRFRVAMSVFPNPAGLGGGAERGMDFKQVGKIAPTSSPSQRKPGVIQSFVWGYTASASTSFQ